MWRDLATLCMVNMLEVKYGNSLKGRIWNQEIMDVTISSAPFYQPYHIWGNFWNPNKVKNKSFLNIEKHVIFYQYNQIFRYSNISQMNYS